MSEIPEKYEPPTKEDLAEWYNAAQQLKAMKAKEGALRRQIFGGAFPDPNEGTNNYPLDDGWVLKGKHEINRKVDDGAFRSILDKLRELEVDPDSVVVYKPELKIGEYRKLTDEQRHLLDQALIIKPGSPQLEITLPAKNKGLV